MLEQETSQNFTLPTLFQCNIIPTFCTFLSKFLASKKHYLILLIPCPGTTLTKLYSKYYNNYLHTIIMKSATITDDME